MGRKEENDLIPYLALKPLEINKNAWKVIVEAWENGLSNREASLRASRDSGCYVTETQLNEIIASSEEVASLREFLMADLVSEAKLNIANDIRKGSVSTAKWYLERKRPEEFSSKAAIAFEGSMVATSMEDKKKELEDFMAQFEVVDDEEESLLPEGLGDKSGKK